MNCFQTVVSLGSHTIGGDLILSPSASYTSSNSQVLGSIHLDQYLRFPDAVLPGDAPIVAPVTNSTNFLTISGYYAVGNSLPIDVAAGTTVMVVVTTGSFSSPIQIHGGTTNSGTAYIYLAGTNAVISGNQASDANGQAKNLCIFGLPSLTSLSLSIAGTSFTGVIYAPSADARINSGGGAISMVGSLVANSVTVNGHFIFHFDDDLLTAPFYTN